MLSTWVISWLSINRLVELEIFVFTDLTKNVSFTDLQKNNRLLFNQITFL